MDWEGNGSVPRRERINTDQTRNAFFADRTMLKDLVDSKQSQDDSGLTLLRRTSFSFEEKVHVLPEDSGHHFSWSVFVSYTGPGWLMSVAYLDPGNIESDLQAGAFAGYSLMWVLWVSTLFGLLLQVLAARLGVVTGKNLAENCREYFGALDNRVLYTMMQLAIVGSDIQEIMGSAIAFRILFGFPLWIGCLITGLDTLTFLGLHVIGVRKLELFFCMLIATMCVCFFATFFSAPPDVRQMVHGTFIPSIPSGSGIQAVSIIGAVVMPHNIYLHSALVLSRDIDRNLKSKIAEANKYFAIEAGLALFVSLLINCAIVAVFARGFFSTTCHQEKNSLIMYPYMTTVSPPFACVPLSTSTNKVFTSVPCVSDGGTVGSCMPIGLQGAASALEQLLGNGAKIMWAIGLLAAGQSSTMTGTYAGQFVMEGFLSLKIPNWLRVLITRAISLVPATIVAVLANSDYMAADSFDELLNVLQSLQLPFALLPLLYFTNSSQVMGSEFVNGKKLRYAGWTSAVIVLVINFFLVADQVDFSKASLLQSSFMAVAGAFYLFVLYRVLAVRSIPEKRSILYSPVNARREYGSVRFAESDN